jgi:hypothetical protein
LLSTSVLAAQVAYPGATINSAPFSQRYRVDTDKLLGRWESAEYSLDLIRASYGATFAIVMYSKRLDAAAQTAVSEALRLDRQVAPAREIERQTQVAAEARATEDEARRLNQRAFRP